MKPNEPGTTARRDELLREKHAIEQRMQTVSNPITETALRANYAAIEKELEGYYFDEPVNQPKP